MSVPNTSHGIINHLYRQNGTSHYNNCMLLENKLKAYQQTKNNFYKLCEEITSGSNVRKNNNKNKNLEENIALYTVQNISSLCQDYF